MESHKQLSHILCADVAQRWPHAQWQHALLCAKEGRCFRTGFQKFLHPATHAISERNYQRKNVSMITRSLHISIHFLYRTTLLLCLAMAACSKKNDAVTP